MEYAGIFTVDREFKCEDNHPILLSPAFPATLEFNKPFVEVNSQRRLCEQVSD